MATNPSLLIVPYRFKAAKLYSQLPESGAGDFTVTRSTTATRANASGSIESVASGVPRLDYTGGGCPALLVEPAATNQIRNSTNVGAASGTPGTLPTNWTEALAGLTRQVVGIGTENGVQYIDFRFNGTATGTSLVIATESSTQITAASGQVWTNSAYLKNIASPLPPLSYQLFFREGTAAGVFVANGGTTVVPTSSLLRFSATRTLTGVTTERIQPQFVAFLTNGASYDFTIRIGLPQMELGSVATSVIPTSGTTQTRNADVISLTGASALIGQTQGTIYAEVDIRNIIGGRFLSLNTGSAANRILLARNSNNTITFIVTVSSVNQVVITSSILSVGTYKVAAAYQSGSFALYINGSLIGTGSSGTIPACTNIDLGNEVGTNFWNDRIRAAAIYTSRLSNAELETLTTL